MRTMKNPTDEKKTKYFELKKTLKITNKIVRLFHEIGDLRPGLINEHEAYINAVGATVYFLENTVKEYAELALEIHQAKECEASITSLKLQ